MADTDSARAAFREWRVLKWGPTESDGSPLKQPDPRNAPPPPEGYFIAGWEARQPEVDSLTSERDEALRLLRLRNLDCDALVLDLNRANALRHTAEAERDELLNKAERRKRTLAALMRTDDPDSLLVGSVWAFDDALADLTAAKAEVKRLREREAELFNALDRITKALDRLRGVSLTAEAAEAYTAACDLVDGVATPPSEGGESA